MIAATSMGVIVAELLKHHFAGAVYMREQTLQAGREVEKHVHDYDHLSYLCTGSAIVEIDGDMQVLHGPCAIEIRAGKKHRIQTLTDITWLCIHAESDADPEIIVKE